MPTRIPRTLLADFALDNPTYSGALLAVYEVDENLARTATLAPLYADQANATLLANPQLLNSDGQNAAPIYIDRPVVPVVTRGETSEELGVQGVSGRWRGVWATGTLYYVGERIRDPAGPSTYLALTSHTSSGSFAVDLAALKWEQEIDAASMAAAAKEAVFPPAPGRNGKLLGFNSGSGEPEAVARNTLLVATAPTGGTSTALTAELAETITGYTHGLTVLAEIGTTCGNAPQLNVGGIGLRKIYMSTVFGPVQAVPGDLVAGNWALFAYDSTQDGGTGGWVVPPGTRPLPVSGESLGLLLNPMQEVSQKNGTTAVALGASAADTIDRIGGAENCATLTATAQQVADPFSGISGFRRLRFGHRATIGTQQASLAAGEYLRPWRQDLPGTFWRSLAWGTADARAVDLVAIVRASVAGTYAVALRNGAAARSYVSTVTLAANTPTVILLKSIPGDTGGTWATDAETGLTLDIGAVTGTTFQAASLNAWAAGNFLSHSTATNYGGTAGATLTVGYADIFPSGVLPFLTAAQITGDPLQCLLNLRRPYEDELLRCRRFFPRAQESGVGRFVGEIIPFMGSTLPDFCVWPNGQNLSRTTYAALFAVLGTTHGAGDGSTTFGTPDLRGRSLFGKDDMGGSAASRVTNAVSGVNGGTLGAAGGSEAMHAHAHTFSDPGHTHGFSDPGHTHSVSDPGHTHLSLVRNAIVGGAAGGTGFWEGEANAATGSAATGVTIAGQVTGASVVAAATGASVVSAGAGSSQNMPPAMICNFVLFAGA